MRTESLALRLAGLTKVYGGTTAVDDIHCAIEAGEMVAFLGPSGCGKTSALRMIAGLIAPTRGEIYIGGKPMSRVPVNRRNIGLLFQNYALFPHLTVGQNVAFGARMHGLRGEALAQRVAETLKITQLQAFAERLPAALSGGQQQRVALARALAIEPSVLLLDEPLGALDKSLRETMQHELKDVQRRLGITSIIVTHDQEEAMAMADRIVVMQDGRIEQFGTPTEIYGRPASRFVASFVGTANFLEGEFGGHEGGHALVRSAEGPIAVAGPCASACGPVTVTVRPESIALHTTADAPAHAALNRLPATVDSLSYRGGQTLVRLRLAGGTPLVALHQNRSGPALPSGIRQGDSVLACWTPDNCHLVAA